METMAGPAIDTQVLVILGAAFGVMFATLTTLMVTSIRLQHRDNLQARIETRELIERATEKLAADVDKRFDKQEAKLDERFDKQEAKFDKRFDKQEAKLDKRFDKQEAKFDKRFDKQEVKLDERFDKQEAKLDKRFDKQEGKLDKVVTSLSDARERLARIEVHLGIESPSQTEPESNGDTSEAA